MRRATALSSVALAAALAVTSCTSDGDDTTTTTSAPPTTTVETTSPTSTPTTDAPTTTADTAPLSTTSEVTTTSEGDSDLPTDARSYADELIRAWGRGDVTTVERLAEPGAAAVLADHSAQAGPEWSRLGCEGAAGSSYCTYEAPEGQLVVRVGNEAASTGADHAVTEVDFP